MNITVTQPAVKYKTSADYELVKSAINGNQISYSLLMNRHHNSVFHQMMKMVKNRTDAEDLTSEAFGKAFHKLDSYTPHHAFSTWLCRIAFNNGIDHLRKKRIKPVSIDEPMKFGSDSDFRNILPAKNRNPEEEIIRSQRLQMTRRLLNELKPKYQTMIRLRFFEEYSYEEISNELEIPLGTVKANLHRAKDLLYHLIQKPGARVYFERVSKRN